MDPRILLYSHRLAHQNPTGVARYGVELVRALAALDHFKARLEVSSTGESSDPDWVPPGVGLRRVPGPRRGIQLAWRVMGHPRVDRLVGRLDLLHLLAPALPVPVDAPLVVTVHDLLPIHHPEWYSRKERWLHDGAFKQLTRRARKVIAVSQAVAEDVHATLGVDTNRIVAIPEAARPEFSRPVDPLDVDRACAKQGILPGGYALFLGAVWPRKNIGVLLEAMAALRKTRPDLRLVVIGSVGPSSRPILDRCGELDLGDVVRFTGFLPDDEVYGLLAGALCLVHPSLYEGFGLTPLEAMTAGCPTICSDAGALPEVVGDAGVLVPPEDPDAWKNALDRMAGDQLFRDKLVAAGTARASRFSWSACAQSTADVYTECLRGG